MSTDQPTETFLLTAKEGRGETRFLSSVSVAILATHMGAILEAVRWVDRRTKYSKHGTIFFLDGDANCANRSVWVYCGA